MDQKEILKILTEVLEEMFEVEPAQVTPSAQLYDDLDVDSIDAVDLVAKLSELTGIRVKPEQFKSVETVQDVVEVVETLTSG